MMLPRRILSLFLILLGIFLLGTVLVLAVVRAYFGIDVRDLVTPEEVDIFEFAPSLPYNSTVPPQPDPAHPGHRPRTKEKIPRIIHQTWKTADVPEKWKVVRENCMAMHPEFEFVLWTDASAREFIAREYPWFIPTYDSYPYNIQRADVMRYFILHYYGGVYIDLDIGCKRPMAPLLNFDLILARTIPVGVSNDLLFASPRHPFMDFAIHNLITLNHQYGTSYPTIMFSTGPMFISLQYNLWPGTMDLDNPDVSVPPVKNIRILPKELYGKNALPEETENAFFWHFYGSSWHLEDAGFVTFLGKYGVILMRIGAVVMVAGTVFIVCVRGVAAVVSRVSTPSLPFPLPATTADGRGWAGFLATNFSRPSSPTSLANRRSKSPPYYFFPLWYFSSSPANSTSSQTTLSPPFSSMSSQPTSASPASPATATRRMASYLSNMTPFRYSMVPTEEPLPLQPLKIDMDFPTGIRDAEHPDSPQTPGTASKPFSYPSRQLHGSFRRRRSSSVTLPLGPSTSHHLNLPRTQQTHPPPPRYTPFAKDEDAETTCNRRPQPSKEEDSEPDAL